MKELVTNSKSRRDDTLLTVCFSLRTDDTTNGLQTQKSRRDDTFLIVDKYATYKYMANNNVSSLRDFLFVTGSVRKLKHTVNKVSSLRDLLYAAGTRCVSVRKLKHTVNRIFSLWDCYILLISHSLIGLKI
jgi:hypothetical protein